MKGIAEIESEIRQHLGEAKTKMEQAGVTTTSDGDMTAEQLSEIRDQIRRNLEPIRDELERMLNGQN